MRIYFAQAREATAVGSGSLATMSGEKQGDRARCEEINEPDVFYNRRNVVFSLL